MTAYSAAKPKLFAFNYPRQHQKYSTHICLIKFLIEKNPPKAQILHWQQSPAPRSHPNGILGNSLMEVRQFHFQCRAYQSFWQNIAPIA